MQYGKLPQVISTVWKLTKSSRFLQCVKMVTLILLAMSYFQFNYQMAIYFLYSNLQSPVFLTSLGWPTSCYLLLCWVRNTIVRLINHFLGLVYKVQEFGGLHNPSSTGQWYSRYCWRGCGKMATKANICSSQTKKWKFSRDYGWNIYWVMNVVPSDAKHNTLGVIYEWGLIGTY